MYRFAFIVILMMFIMDCVGAPDSHAKVKEIQLLVENYRTSYPVSIHYKIFNKHQIYGAGSFKNLKSDEKQYVYVNRIPANKSVTVQLDKINVGNRTVINDPCETKLNTKQLNAAIKVGFKGNPYKHGSFICSVSPPQYPAGANSLP